MANTIITPSWVTTDTAVNFKNSMKLIGLFDRSWDDSWENKPGGAQIGYTVQARIQQRFETVEGQGLQTQAILNQTVPISINHYFQTAMTWSVLEATLEIEKVQERYTKPAGLSHANKWDAIAGEEVYRQVYYSIGTPGTPLSSDQTWTDGVAKLHNVAVPEELYAVLDPKSQSAIMNTNFTLFGPKYQQMFNTGQFSGSALGVDEWYWDPNLPMHTTGTFTSSTPAVNGANQTGSTLTIDGMGTYSLKAGDVFTLDGVYALNPVSYVNTGDLQQFSLQADVAGTSTATLTFAPAIITTGPLRNVSGSPADNAAILFMGATGTITATMATTRSKQSFLFNPGAFAFVMADLESPLPGAESSRKSDRDAGISMRWVTQYNIQTNQIPRRIDSCGGVACVLPYFAIRAWS
jgi:hypothetical protein